MSFVELDLSGQMSRVSGGDGSDFFLLTLTDEASRTQILRIEINADQISNLISTRSFECSGELSNSSNIGKKRKILPVSLVVNKWGGEALGSAIDTWNATHKDDGWYIEPCQKEWNSHRYSDNQYKVFAVQYVDKSPMEDL